jgi:hypothetical protein
VVANRLVHSKAVHQLPSTPRQLTLFAIIVNRQGQPGGSGSARRLSRKSWSLGLPPAEQTLARWAATHANTDACVSMVHIITLDDPSGRSAH